MNRNVGICTLFRLGEFRSEALRIQRSFFAFINGISNFAERSRGRAGSWRLNLHRESFTGKRPPDPVLYTCLSTSSFYYRFQCTILYYIQPSIMVTHVTTCTPCLQPRRFPPSLVIYLDFLNSRSFHRTTFHPKPVSHFWFLQIRNLVLNPTLSLPRSSALRPQFNAPFHGIIDTPIFPYSWQYFTIICAASREF